MKAKELFFHFKIIIFFLTNFFAKQYPILSYFMSIKKKLKLPCELNIIAPPFLTRLGLALKLNDADSFPILLLAESRDFKEIESRSSLASLIRCNAS